MTPFGNFLENLRRKYNLQQKQIAHLMNINPSYISLMEKGRRAPPAKIKLNQLISQLKLSDAEQYNLWRSAEASKLSFKLPSDMSCDEFEFIYELRGQLGKLNRDQIVIMQSVLKLGFANQEVKDELHLM